MAKQADPEARWLALATRNGMMQGTAYEDGDYAECQRLAGVLSAAYSYADGRHDRQTQTGAWCLAALAAYAVEEMFARQ
jgi:hypothetical protein